MNADGSNVELLTPKEHNTIHPNWSADSKQVMYCTNDDLAPPKKNEAKINVVDLATKKITPVVTGGINTYGSWSPDMKQIAFRKIIGEENSEVFVANADGSNQTRLTTDPGSDVFPAWSPDGSKIAFASNRDGNYEIYVMNADGTAQTRLTTNPATDTTPSWSPDGSRIAFSSTRTGNGDIYVMNADGSNPVRLTTYAGEENGPDWSVTGNRIAFNRLPAGGGEFNILTMRADGMGWGQIAQALGTKLGPVVSAIKSAHVKVEKLPAATASSTTTASGTAKSTKATTTTATASSSSGSKGITTAGGVASTHASHGLTTAGSAGAARVNGGDAVRRPQPRCRQRRFDQSE